MKIRQLFRQIGPEGIEGFFARKYDKLVRDPIRMDVYKQIAKQVTQRVQSGSILEIGPGPGYISIEIAKLLPRIKIIGFDVSHTMVEIANYHAVEAGVNRRVIFKFGNATHLPFCSESFDFVISNNSLHHWKKPVKIFNELYRVLKDKSEMLIKDLRRDTPKKIRNMMESRTDSWLMWWGLHRSFRNAYTKDELIEILKETHFSKYRIDVVDETLTINLKKNYIK